MARRDVEEGTAAEVTKAQVDQRRPPLAHEHIELKNRVERLERTVANLLMHLDRTVGRVDRKAIYG